MSGMAIIFLVVASACVGFIIGYIVAREDYGSPGEDE